MRRFSQSVVDYHPQSRNLQMFLGACPSIMRHILILGQAPRPAFGDVDMLYFYNFFFRFLTIAFNESIPYTLIITYYLLPTTGGNLE
jgi:hypothetical protein